MLRLFVHVTTFEIRRVPLVDIIPFNPLNNIECGFSFPLILRTRKPAVVERETEPKPGVVTSELVPFFSMGSGQGLFLGCR